LIAFSAPGANSMAKESITPSQFYQINRVHGEVAAL
jgi:hypothetical protein